VVSQQLLKVALKDAGVGQTSATQWKGGNLMKLNSKLKAGGYTWGQDPSGN